MGHERIGALPKSQQWREVVGGLATLYERPHRIDSVATDTLGLVQNRFRALQNDSAVNSSFAFLIQLARSAKGGGLPNFVGSAKEQAAVKPIVIAQALREHVGEEIENAEYGVLAQDAAIDAIGKWFSLKDDAGQGSLFGEDQLENDPWLRLGRSEGFCEIARLYFASLSERYLNYFLEREVANALGTIEARQSVKDDLKHHVDQISKHAFETAQITQSFAAGWFARHAMNEMPSESEIKGFVAHAMGKMRGELNREASRN